MTSDVWTKIRWDRRYFIGGSDARIIMGGDEHALVHLWREKRGEAEPEDLSGHLVVQLGIATEDLNPRRPPAGAAERHSFGHSAKHLARQKARTRSQGSADHPRRETNSVERLATVTFVADRN